MPKSKTIEGYAVFEAARLAYPILVFKTERRAKMYAKRQALLRGSFVYSLIHFEMTPLSGKRKIK